MEKEKTELQMAEEIAKDRRMLLETERDMAISLQQSRIHQAEVALRQKVFIEVALRTVNLIDTAQDWYPVSAVKIAEEILAKAKEFREKK